MTAAPRLLLVTEAPIDRAHGTGVQLERVLSGHRQILHVSPDEAPSPFEHLRASRPPTTVRSFARAGMRRLTGSTEHRRRIRIGTPQAQRIRDFAPEVVLGVPVTNDGVRLMSAVGDVVECPFALWFLDLQLALDPRGRLDLFEALLPRLAEVWTLCPEMLEWLAAHVDRWPASAARVVVPHWCMPERPAPSRTFQRLSTTVMLGNVWDHSMLPVLRQVWRACAERHPGLRPIEWICRRATIDRLPREVTLAPEIEWAGELTEDQLTTRLAGADLAIVPFSLDAAHDYARFSIPSKMGELAMSGVPTVLLAGERTAAAAYARTYGVCHLLTGETVADWPAALAAIIESAPIRAAISERSRAYARAHLGLDGYRVNIFNRLSALQRSV